MLRTILAYRLIVSLAIDMYILFKLQAHQRIAFTRHTCQRPYAVFQNVPVSDKTDQGPTGTDRQGLGLRIL